MSRAIDSYFKLYNNPFIFTPLLIKFYENYHGQEKDILLSYLILPLVLHEDTKTWLVNANKNSSLHSFGSKKENYYGLQKRILQYKKITNLCIQDAIDNKYIEINNDLHVKVVKKDIDNLKSLDLSKKASANIVKIIKDLDIVSIYQKLGIKIL